MSADQLDGNGHKTHPAVAAVLAVTPRDHDGSVITEFAPPLCSYDACTDHCNTDGPAEPIAARQAAAVLRWAADWLDKHAGLADDPQSVRNAADVLRMDADQIEASA